MYLRDTIIRINNSSGQQVEVLDVPAVGQNFNTIQQERQQMDTALNQLNTRLTILENFLSFCQTRHPQVMQEYALVEATKVRVGAKTAPPSMTPYEESLMEHQRQALLNWRAGAAPLIKP